MSVLRERASACLYGIFIGDALAMPVHWYYSLSTLKQHFPNGALRCVVAVGERVGGDEGSTERERRESSLTAAVILSLSLLFSLFLLYSYEEAHYRAQTHRL